MPSFRSTPRAVQEAERPTERLAKPIVHSDGQVRYRDNAHKAGRWHRESDGLYRRLVTDSRIGTGFVAADGHFLDVNQALCDFFGYGRDTLLEMTWQDLSIGDLTDNLRAAGDVQAGRMVSYRVTKKYRHATGRAIWGMVTLTGLRGEAGESDCFVKQIVDVTAEVEARRRAAELAEENRALAQRLQAELDSAVAYVEALLPKDLDGAVSVSSRYLPSSTLAGDSYNYRWLDDDHLVVYLLDVCGHGVAPALLSISVHNMLRCSSMPPATERDPGEVLAELNQRFDMDGQGGKFFTLWYGIYQRSTRTLRYASGGHPPALLFAQGEDQPIELPTKSLPVGTFGDSAFPVTSVTVPHGAKLLVYSDGAYESTTAEGTHWTASEFTEFCTQHSQSPQWSLDTLVEHLRARTVDGRFEDDCSLVLVAFD